MAELRRVNTLSPDFSGLVKDLDIELKQQYPDIQHVYAPLNKLEDIKTAVIAYESNIPVACGCFKINNPESVEIKRMYVKKDFRGKGLSKLILNELLQWAKDLGNTVAVLETGIKQLEAISLYKKSGFEITQNYGPYINNINSICFQKVL